MYKYERVTKNTHTRIHDTGQLLGAMCGPVTAATALDCPFSRSIQDELLNYTQNIDVLHL